MRCAHVSRMMRVKSFGGLSAIAILMLACQTQVVGGGSGSGGSGGSTGSAIDTTSGGGQGGTVAQPPPVDDGPAIAMLTSQVNMPGFPGTSGGVTVATTTGGASDPNELVIFLSNAAQSCADPYLGLYSCATERHQIRVWLTPEHQAVGTYSLWEMAMWAHSAPQTGNGNEGFCGGGGGTYWDGTIEVTAIDATHVDFTLAGTGQVIGGNGNSDGSYSAIRCF